MKFLNNSKLSKNTKILYMILATAILLCMSIGLVMLLNFVKYNCDKISKNCTNYKNFYGYAYDYKINNCNNITNKCNLDLIAFCPNKYDCIYKNYSTGSYDYLTGVFEDNYHKKVKWSRLIGTFECYDKIKCDNCNGLGVAMFMILFTIAFLLILKIVAIAQLIFLYCDEPNHHKNMINISGNVQLNELHNNEKI